MKEQLKSKIKIVYVAIMVGVITLLLSFCMNRKNDVESIPISYQHATYSIDYDNLNAVVGDADYVFIGTIADEEGTVYKNPVKIEDTDGNVVEVTSPYTNYKVDVLKNIKGSLTTEEPIQIQKSGGISEDKSEYLLYEGDELPAVGQTYVFFAYAQPDGSLLLSGPVSNMETKIEKGEDLESTTEFKEVMEAYENQIQTERQRYTSKYEV